MKRKMTLLTLLLSTALFAQRFQLLKGTPFKGTTDGTVHLMDLDNDADLDAFITGDLGGKQFNGSSALYTNDGNGNFTFQPTNSFPNVKNTSTEFADIEGDGDLDLILTGNIKGGRRTATLYLNNGSGIFTKDAATPFKEVSVGDVIIADLDNDGDLDVFISGYNKSAKGRIAHVYKNKGGNPARFELSAKNSDIKAVDEGDVDVADVDGDGDLDLLVTGDTGGSAGEQTNLYLNNGKGTFQEDKKNSKILKNLRDSDADFADIDNDGDQDLLINGRYGTSSRGAFLYKNDGSGNFRLVKNTPFYGGNAGTVDFFDADQDGDQDLLLSGYEKDKPNRNTRLYTNDGSGEFTEETAEEMTGINNSDIAIGDLNKDGFEDLIIVGYGSKKRIAKLYLNNREQASASLERSHQRPELSSTKPISGSNLSKIPFVPIDKLHEKLDFTAITAHRGYFRNYPENSLEAFQDGMNLGIEILEVDCRTTADGIPVLFHDTTVNRVTNGSGRVADMNFNEINQLKLKDKNGKITASTVASLEQGLQKIKGKNTYMHIEVKDFNFEGVIAVVQKLKMQDQVLVFTDNRYAYNRVSKHGDIFIDAVCRNNKDFNFYLNEPRVVVLNLAGVTFNKKNTVLAQNHKKLTWRGITNKNEDKELVNVSAKKTRLNAVIQKNPAIIHTDYADLLKTYLTQKNKR